ncbi:MAG: SIS domain-containing protein [Desulfurococcaceae archaeon]|nr:MAG: SIS domain-containing protein [Desulfurococcaceae archaeon]
MNIETPSRLVDILVSILKRILEEEGQNLVEASSTISEAMRSGGVEYVFGTGHSMLVALEASFRAGNPVKIYPIVDLSLLGIPSALRASNLEKLSGYAKAIVGSMKIIPGSVLVVISNSGKNAAPVELAHEMRSRGVKVIAITSLEYSRKLAPENSLGKRLYEVADIVIDNKVPEGDASYDIGGVRVFPVSTIVNSFIINAINAMAAEDLASRGIDPEVWVSVNIPESKKRNNIYIEKYYDILKHL